MMGHLQPLQVAFQYQHRGQLVHDLFAVLAAHVALDEHVVGGPGGQALVHKEHRQARLFLQGLGKGAGVLGLEALAAIHIAGQAEHEGLGAPGSGQMGQMGQVVLQTGAL